MRFESESLERGELGEPATGAACRWRRIEEDGGVVSPTVDGFFRLPSSDQKLFVSALREDEKAQGRFIHECLQDIDRRLRDAPGRPSDGDAGRLVQTKLLLERELLEHWLRPDGPMWFARKADVFERIRILLADNPCLHHPLLEHIGPEMNHEGYWAILRLLSTHNEVMELERALLLLCTTGDMERSVRCAGEELRGGRKLSPRTGLDAWRLLKMPRTSLLRRWDEPWFCKVVREGFLMSASRPGWKFRAYGSLLVKESWSCPHLRYLLRGMERSGLISRRRTLEILERAQEADGAAQTMFDALVRQQPELTQDDVEEVLHGARLAVSLAHRLLDLGHDMLHGDVEPVAESGR
jgi:hypothetical protein